MLIRILVTHSMQHHFRGKCITTFTISICILWSESPQPFQCSFQQKIQQIIMGWLKLLNRSPWCPVCWWDPNSWFPHFLWVLEEMAEKAMATHSSFLAWKIPGTGEPGGLPSVQSHRVRQDWSDLAAAAARGDGGLLRHEMQNQSRMRLQPPHSCPRTSSFFRHTALPKSSIRIRSKAWGNRQETRWG